MKKQGTFIQNSFNSLLPSLNRARLEPTLYQRSNPSDSLASFQKQLNQFCYQKVNNRNKQNQTNTFTLPSIQKEKLTNQIQFLKTRLNEIQKQKEIEQKIFNRVQKYLLPTFQMNSMGYNPYSNNSLSQFKPRLTFQPNQTKQFDKTKSFKKPIRKRNYLSLFRSAVYAVVFTLWFPNYSHNFTKNRLVVYLKHFLNKQTVIQKIEIQDYLFDTLQIVQIISETQSQFSSKFSDQQPKKSSNNIKKSKEENKINQQKQAQQSKKLKNDNMKFNMKIICKILQKTYENLKQQMKQEQMKSLYYIITSCCLNGGFLVDNIYLKEQISAINFHTQKGYMINDKQKEKLLIINFFFVRIIVFNVLINFQNNYHFTQRVKKRYNLKQKQLNAIKNIISISSLCLLLVCQFIFIEKLYTTQGNYKMLIPKLKPKVSKVQFAFPSNQANDKKIISFYKISHLLEIFQQAEFMNSLINQRQDSSFKKSINYINKITNMIHKQATEWKKGHYKQLFLLTSSQKCIKVLKDIYLFREQQNQIQESQIEKYQTKTNTKSKKLKQQQNTTSINDQQKNDFYDNDQINDKKNQEKKNKMKSKKPKKLHQQKEQKVQKNIKHKAKNKKSTKSQNQEQ